MEKSYVSMEQNLCIVCGKTFDTGSILLDKRLRNSMERHTVTAMGMCPECEKLKADGFVALVECDPAKSKPSHDGTVKPHEAYRTGRIAHLKVEAFKRVFNVPVPPKGVCFVEPGVVEKLQEMQA